MNLERCAIKKMESLSLKMCKMTASATERKAADAAFFKQGKIKAFKPSIRVWRIPADEVFKFEKNKIE